MQRTTLAATLALVLSGSLAFAQQAQPTAPAAPEQQGTQMHHRGHHGPRDPHRQAAMMSKRLNLSPDQSAKVEPILVARQQKMEALRGDTSLTPEARREQFRAVHRDTKQQLDAVLTPEQREQMKSFRHGRHGHGEMQPGVAPTGV